MSVERELLVEALEWMEELNYVWLNSRISGDSLALELRADINKIELLLTQPEPFKPDWVNYRQGVADSTREPLSDKEIQDTLRKCRQSTTWDYGFEAGIEFAEEFHGIRSR